jgi:hypothetical protein
VAEEVVSPKEWHLRAAPHVYRLPPLSPYFLEDVVAMIDLGKLQPMHEALQ